MTLTSVRYTVAALAAVAAPLALAISPAQAATTTPQYTWKAAAVPAGASQCASRTASPNGTQYTLECLSLPAGRRIVVMQNDKLRELADTVGGEKFEQLIPERVSDSGWVYGVVAPEGASDRLGGMRVARWTPAGELQLAPATAESETHQNLGAPTTTDTFAVVSSVNEKGDALVGYFADGVLKSSSWLWKADGTASPIKPINPGRFSDAMGIANDGTIVLSDRVAGKDAYATPRPYRVSPDGTTVALAPTDNPNMEVHSISPNGQHIAGASVQDINLEPLWMRWDAPSFAPTSLSSLEKLPTIAYGVNDAGIFVTGSGVVLRDSEVALKDVVTGTVPAGALESYDVLADGRLFANTVVGEDEMPGEAGWLIPVK